MRSLGEIRRTIESDKQNQHLEVSDNKARYTFSMIKMDYKCRGA